MQKINALGSCQRMLIFSTKATRWRRQRGEHLAHRSLAESGKHLKQQLAGEHKGKRGFEAALQSWRNVIKEGPCLTKVTVVILSWVGNFFSCHNTNHSLNRILQLQGPVDVSLHSPSVIEECLAFIFAVLSTSSQKQQLYDWEPLWQAWSEMEVCEIMDIFPRG